MANKVGFAAVTQDVTFLDSKSTLHGIPDYCGNKSYMFSPTFSFLIISGTNLSLATSSVADVGVHNVNVTVSLPNYPGVSSITQAIIVTITCEVQNLTFSTTPVASTTLQVGIDSQPLDI